MNTFVLAVLVAAVQAGTPLLLAAVGEILAERSGVLNLGVEGMMLVGALAGFAVGTTTGNMALAVLTACCAGGLLAALHAVVTVSLRRDQIVSGLALTLLGRGLSSVLGQSYVGNSLAHPFGPLVVPVLGGLPLVGPMLFQQNILVYLSYAVALGAWILLYRTRPGLHLRAVGENPATADAMGVSVARVRYIYTVAGGVLAGLAGAYLSLAYTPSWAENMTSGRGWIAISLAIFATWDPVRAVWGAYLFGGAEALQFQLPLVGLRVPPAILSMLPYVATIAGLVLMTLRKSRLALGAPAALGVPYARETR
ncbi:MAG: ABC transporter permease [Chloroflexota bacterium]